VLGSATVWTRTHRCEVVSDKSTMQCYQLQASVVETRERCCRELFESSPERFESHCMHLALLPAPHVAPLYFTRGSRRWRFRDLELAGSRPVWVAYLVTRSLLAKVRSGSVLLSCIRALRSILEYGYGLRRQVCNSHNLTEANISATRCGSFVKAQASK